MWKASVHAKSMENEIFQQAYQEVSALGDPAARDCLKCHAPAIDLNGDLKLEQKITWEGVSCDICHSLVSVDLSGPVPRLGLDVGAVKRGPIRNAASMAHDVAYSELHTQSLVCAGCHEYTNREGTPIITTYSEWQGSDMSKRGKTCQSCHMVQVRAHVVDPKILREADAQVNLHEMPGGHSLEQLHKALEMALQTSRDGDRLLLGVVLTNKGAGHAVPTGMPGRRVILEVQVRSGKELSYTEQRVYTRSYVSAKGEPVTRDSGYFSKGVRLVSDTRLKPGERRAEPFRFQVPRSETAFVTVKLFYEHAPTGGMENRTWITFQSESRTLLPATSADPGA